MASGPVKCLSETNDGMGVAVSASDDDIRELVSHGRKRLPALATGAQHGEPLPASRDAALPG